MAPKIKKILYATDLSRNSLYAFRYAVESAELRDAQIHILHVVERMPLTSEYLLKDSFLAGGLDREYEAEGARAVEEIKNRLDLFCARELKEKPALLNRLTIQVVIGHPESEILAKADELKPDLLVMGTHGKGFLAHAFLGSVAQKVLQRVRVPVFIIPIPENPEPGSGPETAKKPK
jgi:nucleotide-binding universal stress UspA family protein